MPTHNLYTKLPLSFAKAFQNKRVQTKLAQTLLLAFVLANFSPLTAEAQHPYTTEIAQSSSQASRLHKKLHMLETKASLPVKSGLIAYEDSPLGERIPLVLIHGIGGTESKLFHWENFLSFVGQNPDFQKKYKIYLYHYDSTRSVPSISKDLQARLKGFIGALNGRNLKILAYSEGGLLVRNALQDSYIDQHTLEVLAIATPFHGSPLANPEWLGQQVKTEPPFSLVKMGQKIAYNITGRKYPSFRQDFHWDNFDGAIPAKQYVKNNPPTASVDYALAKKTNFVTYGSYFGLEVDPSVLPRELDLKTAPPKEKPLVGNLFRKNFLFSLIRNNMGKLPLASKLARKDFPDIMHSGNIVAAEPTISLNPSPLPPEPVSSVTTTKPLTSTSHPNKGALVGEDNTAMIGHNDETLTGRISFNTTLDNRPNASTSIDNSIDTSVKTPQQEETTSIPVKKIELATLHVALPQLELSMPQGEKASSRLDAGSAKPHFMSQPLNNPPEPANTAMQTLSVKTLVSASSAQKSANSYEPVSLMMYNDGISPISSTLWLGRYFKSQTGVIVPLEHLWDALRALKGNANTRLFAGLDHRNWMDGTTRTGEDVVQDLLNPDEPPRTVFEWIIYDLMS